MGGDGVDNFGEAEIVGCHPRLRVVDSLIILSLIASDIDSRNGVVVIDSVVGLILVQNGDDRGCRIWPLYVLPQVPSMKAVESLGFPLSVVVVDAIVGEL